MNPQKDLQRDIDKYPDFREDHEHTTEKCMHLKDEIKRLIHNGAFKQFIRANRVAKKGESSRRKESSLWKNEKSDNDELIGTINVIARGLEPSKAKKKREMQVLDPIKIMAMEELC